MLLKRPEFTTFKPGEEPTGFDVCELKFDGWWGQLLLEGNRWEIWSRSGTIKKCGALRSSFERTLLHGEYLYGTEWAKNSANYDSVAVFGAEMLDGEDVREVPNVGLRALLEGLILRLTEERIRNGVFLVPQWPSRSWKRIWEERVLRDGYEGLVFKNSFAPWGEGFGRMKRTVTMDYVCIGFEPSLSRTWLGRGVKSVVGALFVGGELIRRCRASGISSLQRAEFFQHPEKYIGRVFEAEGKKISARGSLRHPNFLRWRDDKAPEECRWGS